MSQTFTTMFSLLKRLLAVISLVGCATANATTYTAASCGSSDVSTMLALIGAGDTGIIPAGTCTWATGVTWTAPANATLLGAGSLSTQGGGDTTVIVDGFNSTSTLLAITSNAVGSLRVAGLTFRGDATFSPLKDGGMTTFTGGTVRVDHCHFDVAQGNMKAAWFYVYGVMDHCIVNPLNVGFYINGAENGTSAGNVAWSSATGFGTANFFYFEDNLFVGALAGPFALGDGWTGSRVVLRFNTIQGGSGYEGHATGHAGDDRGVRATEVYGNNFTVLPSQSSAPYDIASCPSGTTLIWGNASDPSNVKNGIGFHVTRQTTATYPQNPPTTGWGYCGPTPIATGTVNVTGTAVTWASGAHFDTNWPAGTMIYIVGSTCTAIPGQAPGAVPTCGITAVNSTTSITLANGGNTGGNLTGVAYYAGSGWDDNTDHLGYPCIDQPGRGLGDLLTGTFPTKTNSTTGTVAWPNQALEPIYVWNNSLVPNPGYGGSFYADDTGGRVVADRDYYAQATGIQTNSTTPFDGTTGTGWGTLANRPTTCTTGVGYWATNQGSWNKSVSNPYGVQQNGASGLLYKCTSTNTWTLYYTPYTYPHPLAQNNGQAFLINGVPIM